MNTNQTLRQDEEIVVLAISLTQPNSNKAQIDKGYLLIDGIGHLNCRRNLQGSAWPFPTLMLINGQNVENLIVTERYSTIADSWSCRFRSQLP